MKESTIAKIYIEVLGIAKDGKQGLALTNWRNPSFTAVIFFFFSCRAY